MNLLLDTQIFLQFISGDERLPKNWREAIQDLTNRVYVSSVSIWECLVKYNIGKLPLPANPHIFLTHERETHSFLSLSLDEQSVLQLVNLPAIHQDPFDRMLICQALQHNLVLMTTDRFIKQYPISFFNKF